MNADSLRKLAAGTLLGLIGLGVAWELWLAPLRPHGSWLVLKVLPLLLAVRGVMRGRVYTYRWTMMLVLAYFAEGLIRTYTETERARLLAGTEVVLSLIIFATAIAFVRVERSSLSAGKSRGSESEQSTRSAKS